MDQFQRNLFAMDRFQQLDQLSRHHMVQLLRCLWRHQNLQALALRISCGKIGTDKICADLEKEIGTTCWPRLRGLYLNGIDQYWLQRLPKLEELQILELRDIKSRVPDFIKDIAHSISRCRLLRVVDLGLEWFYDSEIFLTMASGCPLLQRFCVATPSSGPDMTGDQFSRLLQALPQVEFLSLSVRFRMTASKLRDLVNCCSRLKVLQLNHTRLYLSLQSLVDTPALSGLEQLHLLSVYFRNPSRYTQRRCLQRLATEWSRVFPQLRQVPCPPDVYQYVSHLDEPSSNKQSDTDDDEWTPDDGETSLDDPVLGGPGSDSDDISSDWSRVRRRLWVLLGYNMDDYVEVITGAIHIWQTSLEIRTFDWPIIPMQAFLEPHKYPRAAAAKVPFLETYSA